MKRKKKVLKLKKGVRTALIILAIYGVITAYLFYTTDRIEKINDGEIVLVNQNQAD